MSSDEPMHYIANTIYHASDKDCWGLKKGEKRQIKKGGLIPCWKLVNIIDGVEHDARVDGIPQYLDAEIKPKPITGSLQYVAWYKTGEGKETNIEAARNCAIWEDASIEDLQNEQKLRERLPQLRENFKKDIESIGFVF